MAVQQCLARELGRRIPGAWRSRNSLSRKVWRAQLIRQRIVGEQIVKFVAEHGGAAGFKNNDRSATFDFVSSAVQNARR